MSSLIRGIVPPRPFITTIIVRVAVIWIVLRAAVAFEAAVAGNDAVTQGFVVPLVGVAWTWLVVLLAVHLELTRRNEAVFLANLGHSRVHVTMLIVAECTALEALFRVAA